MMLTQSITSTTWNRTWKTPCSPANILEGLLREVFYPYCKPAKHLSHLSTMQSKTENVSQNTILRDTKLVAKTLKGDQNAFGELVTLHQAVIGKRLWKFTNDPLAHEEMVQNVFVEAFQGLAKYRGEGTLAGWLCTIATRQGYRYWKQKKHSQSIRPLEETLLHLQAQSSEATPLETMTSSEASSILKNLFCHLPPRDRLVLTLIYWEEMSTEQAAQEIGWSTVMVKVQTYRARKKLKRLIETHAKELIPESQK